MRDYFSDFDGISDGIRDGGISNTEGNVQSGVWKELENHYMPKTIAATHRLTQ